MKRIACFLLASAVCFGALAGCGKSGGNTDAAGTAAAVPRASETEISSLSICLPEGVDESAALGDGGACAAFSEAFKQKLAEEGYKVDNIEFSVSTSASATCEALSDGSIDLTFLPASQYLAYASSVDVILAATQSKLTSDGTLAKKWNGSANAPQKTDTQVPYGRTLICATTSSYGKKLAELANSGKTISFDDLSKASWAVLKTSTSSDFIYPDLWLSANYKKTTADLPNIITLDGYSALFTLAAQEKVDIIVIGADERMDYAESWSMDKTHLDMTGKMGLGRSDSIFDAINVIGATEPIYGDAVAITKADKDVYNDGFAAALRTALMAMADTDEGAALYKLCGYTGFAEADAADYANIADLSLTGGDT
jgi:phosphonate transport system substrate-binding protein